MRWKNGNHHPRSQSLQVLSGRTSMKMELLSLCAGQHGRCSPHGASLMHINYIQFLKSQLLLISSTTLSLELAHKAAVATRGERLPC